MMMILPQRIETDENAKAPQKQTISHDKLDACRLSLVTMGTESRIRQGTHPPSDAPLINNA